MTSLEIKRRRKELGITQVQLAKMLGVTEQTIVNYEKGRKIPGPKAKMLERILTPQKKPIQPSNITAGGAIDKEIDTLKTSLKQLEKRHKTLNDQTHIVFNALIDYFGYKDQGDINVLLQRLISAKEKIS